jgi:hypothetical protein
LSSAMPLYRLPSAVPFLFLFYSPCLFFCIRHAFIFYFLAMPFFLSFVMPVFINYGHLSPCPAFSHVFIIIIYSLCPSYFYTLCLFFVYFPCHCLFICSAFISILHLFSIIQHHFSLHFLWPCLSFFFIFPNPDVPFTLHCLSSRL